MSPRFLRWLCLAVKILITATPRPGFSQTSNADEERPLGRASLQPTLDSLGPDISAPGGPIIPPPVEKPPRHPVRAVLLTTLAFSINVAWYWWDSEFNSTDWDSKWDWDSWKRKAVTFEAVRLDSNRFSTNAGSHTQGGALIYLIGRGNGLSPWASTLLTFAEVVAWEYVGEFYEKPSVNDMIQNPIAGLAVGEPFHQLSVFFGRGADNGINETLSTLFSPIARANEWADGYRPRQAELDHLGMPSDVWHRFDFYVGLANAQWDDQTERSETLLGLRTQLNTVRGWGRPAAISGFFGAARLTSIEGALALDGDGMAGGLFATRVTLGGYHVQNLRLDRNLRTKGQNLMLSLTNTFDYTNRRRPNLPFDQICSLGVAGPTIDVSHNHGHFEATARLEALPELAMVTSLPYELYRGQRGTDRLKSVLVDRGYYYAYGLNLGVQGTLRYYAVTAGFDARWERFSSIEGLDRFQERLTDELGQNDGRTRALLWLSVHPLRGYTEIRVSLEETNRFGSIGDVSVSRVERRAALTLGLTL